MINDSPIKLLYSLSLLDDVLEDPANNTQDFLHKRAKDLLSLDDDELMAFGKKGLAKREEEEQKEIKELQRKHNVG